MVNLLETGQADADLGGGVYKMRVARPGESKAGVTGLLYFSRVKNGLFLSMVLPSPTGTI